jgi:hypothetical protein
MKKMLFFIAGMLLTFMPVLSMAQTGDAEALKDLNKNGCMLLRKEILPL